ncbi:serine/threonine-protein kinase pim-2-like isoform X2 [Paralichthys olivaceus]|uniref:serine/threonine-protein kinase pim-2-like isoform X2 n=1 Tax=Paralichthys olivaceus TaxID=8255 RepID=UPI00375125A9
MEDKTFSNFLTPKKDSEMVGGRVSPIIISASYMTKTTKRKATTEYEPPLKRQRVGNGTDANTNSGQSAPETVDKVLSGHTSREMVGRPVSPIIILASNRAMTKTTKRKATTENEPPLKRQRVGNTNSSQSAPESVDKVKSSSDKNTVLSGHTSRADFEAKYLERRKLGEGGYGSVYAGRRRSDNLRVAIKHIPNSVVPRQKVIYGRKYRIPKEVLIMHKAAGGPESVGKSAAVSILDWYDLDDEVVLVMERPVRSMELLQFQNNKGGPIDEDQAKIIMKQLVNAAIDMRAKGVFHRDIKSENILIETCSNGLRVRLIDFGCGRIHKKNSIYSKYSGTSAYVPPEFQINGEYMADPTTVWQLASLLFEMLDGFRQFHTTDFIRNEIRISSMWSNDCQDFLNKCLELDPLDRATLEEMQKHPWLNNPVESLLPSQPSPLIPSQPSHLIPS